MPYQMWLATAARAEGLRVVEVAGWPTRGSVTFAPKGLVAHHTAGPSTGGDLPTMGVLINGRAGLPGPLCNYGLGRSGTVYVIAAGRANHAGKGGWAGLSGNSSVVGIEAENDGKQPWPQAQTDAYVKLCTAIARGLGQPVRFGCGHKEWAPNRKPDPHSLNMHQGRRLVEARLGGSPPPAPPPPSSEEFVMDEQARAEFTKVQQMVGSVGSAVNILLRRVDALERRQREDESRETRRWQELFATGAPRKKP